MEISIRLIHNEGDYEAALAEIDSLMDANPGTLEGDRLDVLVTLVEAYEARHWAIAPPDPIEAPDPHGAEEPPEARSRTLIGSRGRVSEVLSRKRALTLPMIRRLAKGLDLRADVLIQEVQAPRRLRNSSAKRGTSKTPTDS